MNIFNFKGEGDFTLFEKVSLTTNRTLYIHMFPPLSVAFLSEAILSSVHCIPQQLPAFFKPNSIFPFNIAISEMKVCHRVASTYKSEHF